MIVSFNCPACDASIEAELKGLKRRVTQCAACNEQVQVPEVPIGPGVVIGNGYRLEEKLGESSLGDIYLAAKSNGSQYRLEVLSGETSRDQEKVTRLMQETEIVASLKHPNIISAVEAGQDSDTYFLVTEYESGMMLNEFIDANGAISSAQALSIGSDIANALKYAWEEQHILHRDIKPQSIYITDDGRAKLTGFGIAKSTQGGQSLGLTGIGFTIGTPEYMSPEQIQAEDLDFRADLYSLGIVLYECVTGELPFQDTAPMLIVQKQMDDIPQPACEVNPNVSAATSALIDKMLAKSRSDRHGSWDELIAEMKEAKTSSATPAAAITATPGGAGSTAATSTSDSNKVMIAVVGFGFLIVLLLIILIVVLM